MGLLDDFQNFAQGASNSVAGGVSAPVDGLAWLLRKAGVPVNKPVGGSDWMRERGLTADAPGVAGLLGEAAGGLLGPLASAKAPQIAGGLLAGADNLAAPATLNKQAGMIKTEFGRIPETTKEIDAFADLLKRQAERAGHVVTTGASNLSSSRYLTFKGAEVPDVQVRLSNHGDRYPNSFFGERFSVDPDSGNTLEVARDWLKANRFNLKSRPKKPAASTSIADHIAATANQVEMVDDLVNGQWVKRPVKFVPVNGKMTTVFLD